MLSVASMRGVARARPAAAAVHWLTRALLPRGTKLDLEKLSVLVLQMAGVASRPFALCTSSTAQARGARMLAWCTHEIRVQVEAVYPWIDPQNALGIHVRIRFDHSVLKAWELL